MEASPRLTANDLRTLRGLVGKEAHTTTPRRASVSIPPPRGSRVVGRGLAELPEPAWPPALDYRYLGYGGVGPWAGYVDPDNPPGPTTAGGGFFFDVNPHTGLSRNHRRMAVPIPWVRRRG